MSRKSMCWDNVTSEVVSLNSRGDVVEIDDSSSEDDVPKRFTKGQKGARRKLSSSSSSSDDDFKTPVKNNKFRIKSDVSSESDDCVVYSSPDEQPSSISSKVKLLTLPKFSYETPDKKTLQKNRKLLCDISNHCGTPMKTIDRLIADATLDFSNLSCIGNVSRKSNGGGKNKKKQQSTRNSKERQADSSALFDALISSGDVKSKENRIFNESVPRKGTDEKNMSKVKIMGNDSCTRLVQAFDNVTLPKASLNNESGVSKTSRIPVKFQNSERQASNDVNGNEPLESFFKKPTTFKRQNEIGNKVKRPGDSKIVHRRTDDSDSTDGGSVENHPILPLNEKTSQKLPEQPPPVSWQNEPILISSDPDDLYVRASPKPPIRKRGKTTAYTFKDMKTALDDALSVPGGKLLSFLSSLDDMSDDSSCHPTASFYKEKFAKKKDELTAILYNLFNKDIFESKLPDDMPLEWSGRLTSSAGITHLSRKIINSEWKFIARITLSKPIVTTAARLRDTLIHEMCHAAVWQLDRKKDGHGSYWKAWTYKARECFPELRPINTCHSYSKDWKFQWECVSCGYTIGRMTKSFNTDRFTCGVCHGQFQLKENLNKKKREANGFAKFVKENYASIKSQGTGHKDVMKLLSQKYKDDKVNKNTVDDEYDDNFVVLSDD